MAGNNNQSNDSGKKFYRSSIPGLTVITEQAKEGEVAPQSERFVPYQYISDIGEVFVHGYLATDDGKLQAILAKDSNVTEIDQEAFEKYTDTENEKVKRAAL